MNAERYAAIVTNARNEIVLADFIDSSTRRAETIRRAKETIENAWITESQPMPGLPCHVRIHGAKHFTRVPERFDMSAIEGWKPA